MKLFRYPTLRDRARPGRSRAKAAKNPSSWRGGPWQYSETLQTIADHNTGNPVLNPQPLGNLLTPLIDGGSLRYRAPRRSTLPQGRNISRYRALHLLTPADASEIS